MDILDNQPFLLLEWVAGEEGRGTDLRGWLHHGPLEMKLALEVAIGMCWGLMHAQEVCPGLVHRDLKPENILMAQGGLPNTSKHPDNATEIDPVLQLPIRIELSPTSI